MKGQIEISTILRLIVIVVAVVIVALVFVQNLPQAESNVELVTSYTMEFARREISCLLNCYASLRGDVDRLLRETSYLEKSHTDKLVEYFHCNSEILRVATMLFELAKWDQTNVDLGIDPEPYVYKTGETQLDVAKSFLYNCTALGDCNDDWDKTIRNFCQLDDYLSFYGYLDCVNDYTLNDYLNPRRFRYSLRRGLDIENDFVCDERLGDDYKGPYDLCKYDSEAKYGDNCNPSWKLLIDQRYIDEEGDYGKAVGRCEDFALLYKTLFRSLGVPESDLTLTLGYCDLPPPCKWLVSARESLNSSFDNCVVPANLTVKGLGVVEGCNHDLIPNTPDEYFGEFTLREEAGNYLYTFKVKQPFNSAAYYRNLTLNGLVGDDVRWYAGNDGTGFHVDLYERNLLDHPTTTYYDGDKHYLDCDQDDPRCTTISIELPFSSRKISPALENDVEALHVTDLDNDGRLDIITDSYFYYGDGAGGFYKVKHDEYVVTGDTNDNPSIFAMGNMNNDGYNDIVSYEVVSLSSESGTINVYSGGLVGYSDYVFSKTTSITVSGFYDSLDLGDLDNDGNLDLVVVSDSPDRILMFLGDGSGGLIEITDPNIAMVENPGRFDLGDLDNDGNLDLVVVSGLRVLVFLGDGSGGFSAPASYTGSNNVELYDFTGDGNLDLVTSSDRYVKIYPGDGSGGFSSQEAYNTGIYLLYSGLFSLEDVDSDNDVDIIVAKEFGTVSMVFNEGDFTFSQPYDFDTGTSGRLLSVASADFDNDGLSEILIGHEQSTDGLQINSFNIIPELGLLFEQESPELKLGLFVELEELSPDSCGDSLNFRLGFEGLGNDLYDEFMVGEGQEVYLQTIKSLEYGTHGLKPYIQAAGLGDGCIVEYYIAGEGLITDSFKEPYLASTSIDTGSLESSLASYCEPFVTTGERVNMVTGNVIDCSLSSYIKTGSCG